MYVKMSESEIREAMMIVRCIKCTEVEFVVQTNPFLILVFPTLVVTPVGFEDQVGTVGIGDWG